MGRGLSKLQRLILDQAKTRKAVLFEEICAMLCMPPCQAVMETLANGDYENRGDTFQTFLSLVSLRDSKPDIWNSAKETTHNMPGIAACFKVYEEAEKKRPIIEASVSRAFTRPERNVALLSA